MRRSVQHKDISSRYTESSQQSYEGVREARTRSEGKEDKEISTSQFTIPEEDSDEGDEELLRSRLSSKVTS